MNFMIFVGIGIVLLIIVAGTFLVQNQNKNVEEPKTYSQRLPVAVSEPNYYGLALLGLIPSNQEDVHGEWFGDIDTGVVAIDPNGNQYHLIKDAFGRTFLR